jgi:hypothetical protein
MDPCRSAIAAGVAFRAFRGTRRASTYREHLMGSAAFARLVAAGGESGLRLVASLDPAAPAELDKDGARRLADEASALQDSGAHLALDDDLSAAGCASRRSSYARRALAEPNTLCLADREHAASRPTKKKNTEPVTLSSDASTNRSLWVKDLPRPVA